jgi:hypothetical protein
MNDFRLVYEITDSLFIQSKGRRAFMDAWTKRISDICRTRVVWDCDRHIMVLARVNLDFVRSTIESYLPELHAQVYSEYARYGMESRYSDDAAGRFV